MAKIILENLTKSFNAREPIRAVDSVNFSVASGEMLALLGPSGSGKTTLLRVIAGLEKPDCGRIVLDGKSVEQTMPEERPVSMAFQYPALLPQLTVIENVVLGLRLRKVPKAEMHSRAKKMAPLLEIQDLLERKPQTLSGGQQQRVALARALITQPSVLLLDEPLANLDPLARSELRDVIRGLQRELALTTIYVTHDQGEASAVADRIALLSSGRLAQVGTAADLYHDPADLFVARFIGPETLNVLHGTLTREGERNLFVERNPGLRIPTSFSKNPLPADKPVLAAFRPESIEIVDHGVPVKLRDSIDYGWKKVLTVDCAGATIRIRTVVKSLPERIQIYIPPHAVFLFDPDSGKRLR